MSETEDRIQEVQRTALGSRLLKGAEVLGSLRRRGLYCSQGWQASCLCQPQSNFCLAKIRWIELYCELRGEAAALWILLGSGEFGVIEAMTVRQWHATGLTALVLVPGSSKVPIRVGRHGTTWKTIVDLGALDSTADYQPTLRSVLKLQEAFR